MVSRAATAMLRAGHASGSNGAPTCLLSLRLRLTTETVFLTATGDDAYLGGGDSDDDTYSDTLDTAKLEAEIRSLRLALGEMEGGEDSYALEPAEPEAARAPETAAAPLAARMAEQAVVRQTLVEYLNELKGVSGEGDNLVEFPANYNEMVAAEYSVRGKWGRVCLLSFN